jgi:4-methyl-5(b-hydroxyethyl)-thiazole monophosphate biosynthesis
VLLLLANGFEELEAAAFTDVMGWSRSDGVQPVAVTVAALHATIRGTWNFTLIPDLQVRDVNVDDYAALAIPGGFEEAGYYADAYSEEFLAAIREFHHAGKWIASVCVGALPLGRSGILRDRTATTYRLSGSRRPDQLRQFGAKVMEADIVTDGRIITSCGPSTATGVAFTLLEKLTTAENRRAVQYAMGFAPEP